MCFGCSSAVDGERDREREREIHAVFCVLLSLCSAFQRVPAVRSALHGTLDCALCNSNL